MLSLFRGSCIAGLVIAGAVLACADARESDSAAGASGQALAPTTPSFTLASGSTSTLLGRATFGTPASPEISVQRTTGTWSAKVTAGPQLDVAVQSIVFNPGAQSGWHSHPGPVFIQVVRGRLSFYESHDPSCTPTVKRAGEGFLDVGDHPHLARNETGEPAQTVVTYFAPVGAGLRIDQPRPGNCPF
jgi:quercetin dioxygenase-like cupin family protein